MSEGHHIIFCPDFVLIETQEIPDSESSSRST
jgi:hypothetical protein